MPADDTAAARAASDAAAGGLPGAQWQKARRSGAENGGCVEIARGLGGHTGIRDSRRPRDGVHLLSAAAFAAFLADVKAGAYDTGHERAEPFSGGLAGQSRSPASRQSTLLVRILRSSCANDDLCERICAAHINKLTPDGRPRAAPFTRPAAATGCGHPSTGAAVGRTQANAPREQQGP